MLEEACRAAGIPRGDAKEEIVRGARGTRRRHRWDLGRGAGLSWGGTVR
jgi:hypothetical protein